MKGDEILRTNRRVAVALLTAAALVIACDDGTGANEPGGGAGSAQAGGTKSAGGGGSAPASGGMGSGSIGACQREADATPTFPAPTALDPAAVARAAAVIGSCMPDDGVARNATHLWLSHLSAPRMYFRLSAQLDCFAHASCGCSAVEQCLSWVYSAPPEQCTGGCDGPLFKGCGDEAQVTVDCSRLGLTCDPEASCVPAPAEACSDVEMPSCTAEGEVSFCDDDFRRTAPCQSLGFACVGGKCVGDGEACDDSKASGFEEQLSLIGSSCSGDALIACLGGRTTTVDCSEQGPGFSCQSRDGASFCGLAAECTPADNYLSDHPVSCEGSVLTFCSAGRLEHVDCRELGFDGCELDTKAGKYGCTPGAMLR